MKKATLKRVVIKRKDYGRVSSNTTYTLEETGRMYYDTLPQLKKKLKRFGYTDISVHDGGVCKMNY